MEREGVERGREGGEPVPEGVPWPSGGILSRELSRDARSQRSSHHNARRLTRGPRVSKSSERRKKEEDRERKVQARARKVTYLVIRRGRRMAKRDGMRRREMKKDRKTVANKREGRRGENDGWAKQHHHYWCSPVRPPIWTTVHHTVALPHRVRRQIQETAARRTERESRYNPAVLCAMPSVTGSFSRRESRRNSNDCANLNWREHREILFQIIFVIQFFLLEYFYQPRALFIIS